MPGRRPRDREPNFQISSPAESVDPYRLLQQNRPKAAVPECLLSRRCWGLSRLSPKGLAQPLQTRPGNRGGFVVCMSRKKTERRPCTEAAAPKLPIADEAPQLPTISAQPLRMRLGAGRHAVKAAEV